MILKYRMLSDENDNFVRDLELPHDMTLLDLHRFLTAECNYDDSMASFYTADEQWQRGHEFTAMDMGFGDASNKEQMPSTMQEVSIADLIVADNNRLIYVFDTLNDRAYYLELVDQSAQNPDFDYPRVAFAHGAIRQQYEDASTDPDEDDKSIFEEMMDDFGDFEGDENMDDE